MLNEDVQHLAATKKVHAPAPQMEEDEEELIL
jgi:hypothetical protein